MNAEYYEYTGLAENALVRKYIIMNPLYENIVVTCRNKSVRLPVVVRVVRNNNTVNISASLFDTYSNPAKIIEIPFEEIAVSEFENMHEYYLFGLSKLELEDN